MIISAIVAVSSNGVIGKDNQIPWYLPEDLKYFKKVTLGHPVIMGRKSFLSIGRPLPKRTNIIITRDPFFVVSGCLVVNTIEEGLEWAMKSGDEEKISDIYSKLDIIMIRHSLKDRVQTMKDTNSMILKNSI